MEPVRLALIEDHHALLLGLELLLEREGCDVIATARGADDGFAMVRDHEPDVTVIDVDLGEESGIELMRDLLREDPERKFVLYTGSSDTDALFDGFDSGARGFALKEGAPSELLEAIRVVAAGGTYVDPRLRPLLLSARASQRAATLSAREREIIGLLADGLIGDEIADRLFLSTETVKTHIRNAMTKLQARNRVHAIAIALRYGMIDRVAT